MFDAKPAHPYGQQAAPNVQPVYAQPYAQPYGQPQVVQQVVVQQQVVVGQAAQPMVQPVPGPQPQVVVMAPEPQRQERLESVPGFGFLPDYKYKNPAQNLAGFYVSCTGAPAFWCDDPCPCLLLCCINPLYVPYPCPAVRCLQFSYVDDDTLKLSCGTCMCCPLSIWETGSSGALYRREDGEDGRPLGPPNAFSREDGKGRFEVSQYRMCGATLGFCYCRIC